jgi:SAM-dependent methyltransferase
MLCFSVGLRPARGQLQWSDVLPSRGFMSYAGAMGEAACSEAVRFCLDAHRLREGRPYVARPREGAWDEGASDDDEMAAPLPEAECDAPGLVLDPFCGHGTVLALANAWGFDAIGVDTNFKRCEVAEARAPKASGRARAPTGTGEESGGPAADAPNVCGVAACDCDGDHPHCKPS